MEVTVVRRRTKAQTRDELLETGGRILIRRGPGLPVQHVRLTEALRATGLTVGAAYRIWERQEDYHRDLGRWAARWCRDRLVDRLGHPAESPAPLGTGLEALLDALARSEDMALACSLVGMAGSDPDIRQLMAERTSAITRASRASCAAWLSEQRRRVRPGLSLDEVASIIASMIQGIALTQHTDAPHATLDAAVIERVVDVAAGILERSSEPAPRPPGAMPPVEPRTRPQALTPEPLLVA